MRIGWLLAPLALFLAAGAGYAAPISWINDADGDWNDAANWDAGVPTAVDDVTIDRGAANPTVTHSANNSSVASLVHEEVLVVDGGTLDTGAFSAGSTSSVSVDGAGVRFAANGATSIDGATLAASGGGLLDLSAAAAYASGGRRTIRATGSASAIDLSGVTSLTGAQLLNQELEIDALSGGRVDLSGVTSLPDSSVRFRADGTDSEVDLSSLTTFTDTGSTLDISVLQASDGGAIVLPGAATSIDGYSVFLDGETSVLDTSQVTSLTNSVVTARGGNVTLDLSALGSFDGNSYVAESGAFLEIGASSYSSGLARRVRATGAGSEIRAGSVTSLTGATRNNVRLEVEGLSGGEVDLSNLTSLADSSVRFRANGAGSQVNLQSLTTFTDTGSTLDVSLLEASDGGELVLAGAPISIDGYSVFRSGETSLLDTSQVTSLTNSTVTARGVNVTLDLSGLGSFDGNSYVAESGAFLEIDATSYSSGLARRVRATGAGSEIRAGSVTSLSGATANNVRLEVEALSGGQVDLSNLTNLADSSVRFRANGAGSQLDLRSVTTFTDTGSSLDISLLEASDGGELVLAGAATSIDGYSVFRSGETSVLDTSQVTSLTNSTVTARGDDVTLDLAGLGSFDGNSYVAESGAFLEIGSTSYSSGLARRLRATGAGSEIRAGSVTSLTGGTTFNRVVDVEALSGGEIDLSSLVNLSDSSVRFRADGAQSRVDLSSLTTFTDTGASIDRSTLEARNGGTVLLPSASSISIDGYLLTVEGESSTLDTSGVTSLTNSTAQAIGLNAQLDLSALVSADGNSFVAENGARLDLAAADYTSGVSNQSLRATGTSGATAALIEASGITSLEGSTATGAALNVDAFEGGRVDLSGLGSITGGAVQVEADGTGSVVDLSALTSFVDTGSLAGSSRIEAGNGGEVLLPAAASTALSGVDLFATATGAIRGRLVEVLGGSRVAGEGGLDLGAVIDGGRLDPGARGNEAGSILLNGDLEITADGVYEVDIGGLLPEEFDSIDVLARAILAGTIEVDFIGPPGAEFDPEVGDRFVVVSADEIVDAGFVIDDDFGDSRSFVSVIESGATGDDLVLVVVPEPSTALLLGAALALGATSRRRGGRAAGLRPR